MKALFNELLQNAAFPAIVLALTCSAINSEIPKVYDRASIVAERRIMLAPKRPMRESDTNYDEALKKFWLLQTQSSPRTVVEDE
jgi:hypothetical protein